MKSHPQHLADLLELDRDGLTLVESDPESGRRRYLADDMNTYDVEPVQRRGDDGELVTELRVAVVLPLDEYAYGLDGDGTCPTCGRPRGRATRRHEVTGPEHLRQVLEEHAV